MTKPVYFKPYQQEEIDFAYNSLFCDNLNLYQSQPETFQGDSWKPMLTSHPKLKNMRTAAQQPGLPARLRILAFNYLLKKGEFPVKKELLGVILEAGVDDGLETLAAYTDYSVVYIDSRGVIKHWAAVETRIRERLVNYFASAATLAEQLRPSDKPRFPPPFAGMARVTLLLSDGRYFGQGPGNNLTKDAISGPIIRQANNWLAVLLAKEKLL